MRYEQSKVYLTIDNHISFMFMLFYKKNHYNQPERNHTECSKANRRKEKFLCLINESMAAFSQVSLWGP